MYLFSIILGPCQAEFDITIIDRISALLNPQPVFSTSSAYGLARGNIVSSNFLILSLYKMS